MSCAVDLARTVRPQAVARGGLGEISVCLGSLASPFQSQLDRFKVRALRAGLPVEKHLYATEWRSIGLASKASDASLVLLCELPAQKHLHATESHSIDLAAAALEESLVLLAEHWQQSLCTLEAALTLVQASNARMWLVSRDVQQPVGAPRAVHAGIWGLTRSARTEAQLPVLCLDLPVGDMPEAGGSSAEPEVLVRPKARLVPRLVYMMPRASNAGSTRVGASHLITGGTSGLGLLTARWLGRCGASALTLASRGARVSGDGVAMEWAQLCGSDASVCAERCDTAEEVSIRQLMSASALLGGIWHAAGVLADGVLSNLTALTLARAYAPKAHGAWSLHLASARAPLGVCALFSSVASLLGGAGQANYAAASACLDALAFHRRAHGHVSVSMQWGAWAEVGMAARGAASARMATMEAASGFGRIGQAMGLAALDTAIAVGSPCLIGATLVQWRRLLSKAAVMPAFLSEMAPARSSVSSSGGQLARKTSTTDRCVTLESVLEMARRTAGGTVDADAPLLETGVDSLGAVELRNQLQDAAGGVMTLPSTLVFDHPTARLLATLVGSCAAPCESTGEDRHALAVAADERPCVVVQLPGLDGSFLHFAALNAWLTYLGVRILEMPFVALRTESSVRECLADLVDADVRVVTLGYSVGATMALRALRLIAGIGVTVHARILIDPSLISPLVTPPADLSIRFVATSVMDAVPEDLDTDLFKQAIVSVFPSFADRFTSQSSIVQNAASQDDVDFIRSATAPMLLLISTDSQPVMDPFAGGSAAEAEWALLCPAAIVHHVKATHITIPYAPGTALNIVSFLMMIRGLSLTHNDMERGRAKFMDVKAAIEGTQKRFRDTWSESGYGNGGVDFRRAAGSTDIAHVRCHSEYAYIGALSRARPEDVWSSTALHGLYWHRDAAWVHLGLGLETDGEWQGWRCPDGTPCTMPVGQSTPWATLFDDADAPFVRWFVGGATSAAFNELDRHELADHGSETAFICERESGESPVRLLRRELLIESTLAALALHASLGVGFGDRIAVNLPNDVHAIVWIAAAKRIGAPYTAIAAGTASASLADRLADTNARVLVTSNGLTKVALEALADARCGHSIAVVAVNADAENGLPSGWNDAHALLAAARAQLISIIEENSQPLGSLAGNVLVRALWSLALPQPVDASHPLFILYTSGSTGKPKGIVHGHGGYLVGLLATSGLVLDLRPERDDTLFVVATPGWITGQSYMITTALLCRVPSVLLDGSPVSPPDRFAAVIARHRVSVFKAGSTFLRMLMTRPNAEALLAQHSLSSLRLGTFCAEPVNDAVHRFAASRLTANYINSYWATEHGGMVWSRCHGNVDQPLQPDTRTWPLPWIDGVVMVPTYPTGHEAAVSWRKAAPGEQGEVIIRRSYPYLALTVWSSDGFGTSAWRGDLARWSRYFAPGAGYVQGDAAVRHADGAYTFHGRSDEVMNVGGNRIGTEEIESAVLLDRGRKGSPLRDCVVVGMADAMLGTAPCAFLVLQPGAELTSTDEGFIRATVQARVSSVAVPARFVVVPALPETYSGKYMRGLLRAIVAGEPLGNLGAVKNPECIEALREIAAPRSAADDNRPSLPDAQITPASGHLDVGGVEDLTADIIDIVQSIVGGSDITALVPLMSAGLNSLGATQLSRRLEERTGLQLSPTLVFEYSTAGAIAAYLRSALHSHTATPPDSREPVYSNCGRTSLKSAEVSGLSSMLPAGMTNLAAASHATISGADMICVVPARRWDSQVLEGGLDYSVAQRAQHGGFACNVQLCDGAFFGILPAEAAAMDPQQRLLLERGHEALHCSELGEEPAGDRAMTGVFVGVELLDFMEILLDGPTSVYLATGASISVTSGRLSFALGLHGPCAAYVTACSASLTAYHGSRRSIQLEESSGAIAAGVNMMLLPGTSVALGLAGMTSAKGRCHTFDVRADGYARGEACVAVALHSRAGAGWTAGGSAVRSDGRSASLTAPNARAQRDLITAALVDGALSPNALAMHEAHGTGTALGDPIEAGSLAEVLLGARDTPLVVGGVKANIGHVEPAAGMTGLLALALGLQRGAVAATAQLRLINPHVGSTLRGVTCVLPLQPSVINARAGGVSSFGYSGTIVSALLQVSFEPTREAWSPLAYRRRGFPWRQVATCTAAIDHRGAYSVSWAPFLADLSVQLLAWMLLARSATPNKSPPASSRTLFIVLHSGSDAMPSLHGTQLAMSLAQRLADGAASPRMLLLTCGTLDGTSATGASEAAHGGAWGFARVLRLEHPTLGAHSADVVPGVSVVARAALSARLSEPEAAWRSTKCFAARLRACVATSSRGLTRTHGLHAITGGLGGLGLRAAVLLEEGGASRVLLSSRSGRVVRDGQGLEAQLRAVGVVATVVACNVANSDDALALLVIGRPVCVLHAAGGLRDALLRSMLTDDLNASFAPKALAASRLSVLMARSPLEALCLFSSVASTFGNVGQANYAAANAYLDALARCRRRHGTLSSSLQIPPVSGAGMSAVMFATARSNLEVGAVALDEFGAWLVQCVSPAMVERTQTLLAPVLVMRLRSTLTESQLGATPVCNEEELLLQHDSALPRGTGEHVRLCIAECVALVELNDPLHFNTLTAELAADAQAAVAWVAMQERGAVQTVVLQGAGDHFCPGGNMFRVARTQSSTLVAAARASYDLFDGFCRMRSLPMPVICAAHGNVLGGGLAICLLTDFVITSYTSTFQVSRSPCVRSPARLSKDHTQVDGIVGFFVCRWASDLAASTLLPY